MSVIICPGVHSPELTQSFWQELQLTLDHQIAPQIAQQIVQKACIFPAERFPAYSPLHVLKFIDEQSQENRSLNSRFYPLLLIGFSAGVVGALGAAQIIQWRGDRGNQYQGHQHQGNQYQDRQYRDNPIQALIAIDGWGLPLVGNFPIHRVSHDFFTHCSTFTCGPATSSFYADPGIGHLDLWRSPQSAVGWSSEAISSATHACLDGPSLSSKISQKRYQTTAAEFLKTLIIQYQHEKIRE
jgi:hypothetical protein